MITRAQLRALIDCHDDALHLADRTANALDGAAILATLTNAPHRDDTIRLVRHASELHNEIRHLIARLEEVRPDA